VTLSRPEIEQNGLKEDTDFSFSASFETEPTFDPQGYSGMELEKINMTVSEDDMAKRLKEISKMFPPCRMLRKTGRRRWAIL